MDKLKYPIGKFQYDYDNAAKTRQHLISTLGELPDTLAKKLSNLHPSELEKSYRTDGWTVRQLVHHLADSHANMYIRVKSALTNSGTPIMGYDEVAWAKFTDNELPLDVSVKMLGGIHARICHLFNQFEEADWEKTYFHNGEKRLFTLQEVLALYAWHSKHHLAHIELAVRN